MFRKLVAAFLLVAFPFFFTPAVAKGGSCFPVGTIHLIEPANNATVSGTVDVIGTDDEFHQSKDFYLQVCHYVTTPYYHKQCQDLVHGAGAQQLEAFWDTTTVPNGSVEVWAVHVNGGGCYSGVYRKVTVSN